MLQIPSKKATGNNETQQTCLPLAFPIEQFTQTFGPENSPKLNFDSASQASPAPPEALGPFSVEFFDENP